MFTLAHSTRLSLGGEAARAAAASLFAIGSRVVRELRLRRAIRAMQDLDDAMLHDVGLTRDEIEGAVRHGRYARCGLRI
jgi:uncharacterized protein YjiS (DUF1127 family)